MGVLDKKLKDQYKGERRNTRNMDSKQKAVGQVRTNSFLGGGRVTNGIQKNLEVELHRKTF